MGRARLKGSTGERLLRVLTAVVDAQRPLSLPDVTETVDLPKPTVHRLMNLLEDTGFAIKDPAEKRFVPGPTMRRLAREVIAGDTFSASRHKLLQRMARSVGETCNIVVLDGLSLIYVDRVDTAWPLRITFEIGSRVPVHCTATGKLLLALQPKRVRERILRNSELEAMTEATITDPDALRTALKRISKERVGIDNQEFIDAMVAVSVPITPPEGPPIAAVSIHAPIARRSLSDLRAWVPQLRETADALSVLMYGADSAV